MSQAVTLDGCTCPGSPHAGGDVVQLRDKLGFTGGAVLQAEMEEYLKTPLRERGSLAKFKAKLMALYVEEGIEDWNLVDDKGEPLAVTTGTIRAKFLDDFADAERAAKIADKADDLYFEPVLAPLVNRVRELSQRLSTRKSMSRTPSTAHPNTKESSPSIGPSSKPRKRSKPSSTSTTQTAITATISA